MSIGGKLKNLRLKMKKTLKDESEIFDVSINTVYRWEHGLTIPRKSSLKKIAAYYNVSMDWLLDDSGAENTKCDGRINTEESQNIAEQLLLRMFRKLSDNKKYKILGYIERICVEDMDEA